VEDFPDLAQTHAQNLNFNFPLKFMASFWPFQNKKWVSHDFFASRVCKVKIVCTLTKLPIVVSYGAFVRRFGARRNSLAELHQKNSPSWIKIFDQNAPKSEN
jgi:hypothetical protein